MTKVNGNIRIELDVASGLETTAKQEMFEVIGKNHLKDVEVKKGAIQCRFYGELNDLTQLRTVEAAYILRSYDIPRPKALLGDQNFRQLMIDIQTIFESTGRKRFKSLYVNAAGSNSSVMQRIKFELATANGLSEADDAGDLLLRIRKSETGWEVLTRITPRPLATRSWRVCDYEGALNAPLAHAMCRIANPDSQDVVINLMCGSGTLMTEFLLLYPSNSVYGIDNSVKALQCALRNLEAAQGQYEFTLIHSDVLSLPFPAQFASVLLADFPFGNLVGSHLENVDMYPKILREAARISRPDARFVLITHEVNLILSVLQEQTSWELRKQIRVSQRGLTPLICFLQRSS